MLECKRCGHKWKPKVADPVRCPYCTSTYWNIPKSMTTMAREAVKTAPAGVDRVDFYANDSHIGSIAVPEDDPIHDPDMCQLYNCPKCRKLRQGE